MFNELLYDKNLRNEITNTDYLLYSAEELSPLPKKSKRAGLFTILDTAQFYRTKTQLITDILEEHLDEFIEDGYRQYTQLEIINAYTNPFIPFKEIKKIEQVRNFVNIEYKDGSSVQINDNGKKMLTKQSILRIACFLEGSSIAKYIRGTFLENKALTNSLKNQLTQDIKEELLYDNLQTKLIEEKVKAELRGDTYAIANLNHELFTLKNQKIREKLLKGNNKKIVDFYMKKIMKSI